MAEKHKILVVDDTITYRKIMSDVVEGIANAELLATAPNGRIALKKIQSLKPDIVLLDVEMPGMDGLETLREIKKQFPDTGVIMVSGANATSANLTIEALEAGAIDFVPKPSGLGQIESIKLLRKHIDPLLKLHTTKQLAQTAKKHKSLPQTKSKAVGKQSPVRPINRRIAPVPTSFNLLAIGVSTGGPEALVQVIPKLPRNIGVPVLMVQHMPPVFTASLAKNLNLRSKLTVQEAKEGDVLKKNHVYIAPGGHHMVVRKDPKSKKATIALNSSPPVKSCRPSVDVLFRSISSVYSGNVLAVVMTGMGDDGADGIAALKRKGCLCFTQSEDTCVVYGMPRAVDEAGLSDQSIKLDDLADTIAGKLIAR